MIYGVGIDLVKIDRMKEVVEKWGQRFLERVFTAGEISYCYEKKNPYLSLSVRFAAKEALIKAIGSAGSCGFNRHRSYKRRHRKTFFENQRKT